MSRLIRVWLLLIRLPCCCSDAGSSTPANLPVERGFTSSLGYMGGAEDHYSQIGDYKEGGNGTIQNALPRGFEGCDSIWNRFRHPLHQNCYFCQTC